MQIDYYTAPDNGAQGVWAQMIHRKRLDGAAGLEDWSYYDSWGRPVVHVHKADTAAGDKKGFVVDGGPIRNAKGSVVEARQPWFWDGSGNSFSVTYLFAALNDATIKKNHVQYDAFGRVIATSYDGTSTTANSYHALSQDQYDATALNVGPRVPKTLSLDGHGRSAQFVEHVRTPSGVDDLTTTTSYLITGEPTSIQKSHSLGSDTSTRTLKYDSLGRLVTNIEPNTSTSPIIISFPAPLPKAWTYAYDDAGDLVGTSDARGCGEDLYYDGVGRLLAEDYSPCLSAQAPFTRFDPATGNGSETYYQYDAPEAGQTASPFLRGQLAAMTDRASHMRFDYDGRSRVVGVSRQIAKPGVPDPALASRFAPTWSVRSTKYDEADRSVSESTGADVASLLRPGPSGALESVVRTSYTARGFVGAVGSTYGPLVKRLTYDFDGLNSEVDYADAASTIAQFGYDTNRRLVNLLVQRAAPSFWKTVQAPYTSPGGAWTTPLVLANLAFKYDPAGNLKEIDDNRSPVEWPVGAAPVASTSIAFDDLYRVTRVDYKYATSTGTDTQVSPFKAEEVSGNSPAPSAPTAQNRVSWQTFQYDWLDNVTASDDNEHLFAARSLQANSYGVGGKRPNQLVHAAAGPCDPARGGGGCGSSVDASYDTAGNLVALAIANATTAACTASRCSHQYAYDWDEVGNLIRAQRWDGAPTFPSTPTATPNVSLTFAYDGQGTRVLTAKSVAGAAPIYRAEIFATLRLDGATFTGGDYTRTSATETIYLASGGSVLARVLVSSSDPQVTSASALHVFLELGGAPGEGSMVLDRDTSELVEYATFAAYGATDSDERIDRWGDFRESYRFTGKEDDVEVGLTYFGARYYSPLLKRWLSPDPMTIHGLAGTNPYTYVNGAVYASTDPSGLQAKPGPSGEFDEDGETVDEDSRSDRSIDPTTGRECIGRECEQPEFKNAVKADTQKTGADAPKASGVGPPPQAAVPSAAPVLLTPPFPIPSPSSLLNNQYVKDAVAAAMGFGFGAEEGFIPFASMQRPAPGLASNPFFQTGRDVGNIVGGAAGVAGGSALIAPTPLEEGGSLGLATPAVAAQLVVGGAMVVNGAKTALDGIVHLATKGGPKSGSAGGPGAGKGFSGTTKEKVATGKCVFCGDKTTKGAGPKQSQTDHAYPKSRGGNDSVDNAQETCRTCNLQKSDMTTLEFLLHKLGL